MNIANSAKQKRMIYALFAGILLLFVIHHNLTLDADTWHLLTSGKYLWENKALPDTNPWVVHDDLQLIIQQWLSDIVNYAAWLIGKEAGILVLALVQAGVFLLAFCRYLDALHFPVWYRKETVLGISLILISPFFTNRPQIISCALCLFASAFTLEWLDQKTSFRRYLIRMTLVALVMANWQLSMIIALPIVTAPLFLAHRKSIKYGLITYLCCGLAMMCNPYGPRGLAYLYLSRRISTYPIIQEILAPELLSVTGFVLLGIGILFALYIVRSHVLPIDLAFLVPGTMLLAAMAGRNQWFLAFGLCPLIARYLSKTRVMWKPSRFKLIIFSLLAGVMLLDCVKSLPVRVRDDSMSPVAAVEYLRENAPSDVRLYTGFNSGNFMEWSGFSIYLDARPELFLTDINGSEDIYIEYIGLFKNRGLKEEKGCLALDPSSSFDYVAFLDKYNFDYLLITDDEVYLEEAVVAYGYDKVLDANGYRLYEKGGSL